MSKIVKLSDNLSNLIAAGEVVVNMASVVKELVENSIDANSKNITIDLEESGLLMIRVTDDGMGMGKDDIHLSILRHATSKIKTKNDLFHITSLGFRGEALPSIASVSHLEIESSEGETGHYVYFLNGKVSAIFGTHTHVQTADEQISKKGTAYITDVGMVGYADGCIGLDKTSILKETFSQINYQHIIPEKGNSIFNAIMVTINPKNGKAVSIKSISKIINIK